MDHEEEESNRRTLPFPIDDDEVLGNWFDEQYHRHHCWYGREEEEVGVGSCYVVAYDFRRIEMPQCDDFPWIPLLTKTGCSAAVADSRPWVRDKFQTMTSDEHSEEVGVVAMGRGMNP